MVTIKEPEFYEKKIAEKEAEIEHLLVEMRDENTREKRGEIVRIRSSIYDLQEELEYAKATHR